MSVALLNHETGTGFASSESNPNGRTDLSATKSRILVIDDDRCFCELLSLYFGAKGFDVMTAQTAAEAAVLLAQGQFGLAILDWCLDRTDALDLLNLSKNLHPDLPVIIFTGCEGGTFLTNSLIGRADAVVRKMGSLDALSTNVFRCLGLAELKVMK